ILCTPPRVENGDGINVKPIYKENERYHYKCKQGYMSKERGDAICTGSGWSPQPSCEVNDRGECNCHGMAFKLYLSLVIHSLNSCANFTLAHHTGKTNFKLKSFICDLSVFLVVLFNFFLFQVKPCEFPQFKHGHLYYEERVRSYFPVSIGKKYSYKCDNGFSPPSGYSWDYLRCTAQGWEPEVPCLRKCVFHYVENGKSSYWEVIYMQGQSVKVQCHSGYSLPNGQDTITCTEKGWSTPPKCILISK
ncbi:complement factor H-like, partial [Mus pahari]|uniref:complement factor H-like n=1 Tax=Mus pahari TaxID=10093 RepID=UPI001114C491